MRTFYIACWENGNECVCYSDYDTFEEAYHMLEYYADERCGHLEELDMPKGLHIKHYCFVMNMVGGSYKKPNQKIYIERCCE